MLFLHHRLDNLECSNVNSSNCSSVINVDQFLSLGGTSHVILICCDLKMEGNALQFVSNS